MEKFEIAWQAPEYEHREKGVSWYWVSIIAAAIVVAFSVWEKNFLFGLFIVIAEMLFIVWGNRPPRIVSFLLNERGLEIEGKKFHDIRVFDSMSVENMNGGWSEIFLIFRSRFKTPLKIIFPESRLEELRDDLATILKEIPHEPTLLDSIEKILRF